MVGEPRCEVGTAPHEHELSLGTVFGEHGGEPLGYALHLPRFEIGLDLQQLAALLEGLALEWRRNCNRLVRGAHRTVPVADRGASLRNAGQEMRQLQRGETQLAGERDRPFRVL